MPRIDKIKKTKNTKLKKTALPARVKSTKTKKVKHSPVEYYNCLLTQAQNDWFDPQTGKKKKITACCKDCRLNAPTLNKQKNQELQKLITSYRQVGESLTKLLRPIE